MLMDWVVFQQNWIISWEVGNGAMSLDKAIKHKKEKRKPYRKSKAIDSSCRNNKGCPWCEGNRKYQSKKALESAKDRKKMIFDIDHMSIEDD